MASHAHLEAMGFKQLHSDPCIYKSKSKEGNSFIAVYVDDMVLAGVPDLIKEVKEMLASKFSLKDLGRLTYFLGISVAQNQEELTTWMGQPAYVKSVLEKRNMSDCKQVTIPTDPGSYLLQATETEEAVEQRQYQSLVRSLMYLSVCTRPDIAYAISCLEKFFSAS